MDVSYIRSWRGGRGEAGQPYRVGLGCSFNVKGLRSIFLTCLVYRFTCNVSNKIPTSPPSYLTTCIYPALGIAFLAS